MTGDFLDRMSLDGTEFGLVQYSPVTTSPSLLKKASSVVDVKHARVPWGIFIIIIISKSPLSMLITDSSQG